MRAPAASRANSGNGVARDRTAPARMQPLRRASHSQSDRRQLTSSRACTSGCETCALSVGCRRANGAKTAQLTARAALRAPAAATLTRVAA